MFLQIDKKYAIESNSADWAITRKKKEWRQIAWYSTLEGAINGLAQKQIRASDAKTVDDAIKDIKQISEKLAAALSPKYEIKTI